MTKDWTAMFQSIAGDEKLSFVAISRTNLKTVHLPVYGVTGVFPRG
jgi:hypothetical protein